MAFYLIMLCSAWFGQVPGASIPHELAAEPYVDGSIGFSIRPPLGWQVARQRHAEPLGVTVLRMIENPATATLEEISIKQIVTPRVQPIDAVLKQVSHSLELEFSNLEVQSQQSQPICGKPGGIITAKFMREGASRLRFEAVVEIRPRTYLAILYSTPAEKRAERESLFHLVLNSLKVLSEQVSEEQMKEALQAAVKWQTSLTPDAIKKSIGPDQYLKYESAGKDIGFVGIQQKPTTFNGHEGILVRERGWMFENDGRVTRMQSDMSLSFDRRYEKWKTSVTTLYPAKGQNLAFIDASLEDGLRTDNLLLSNQTYHLNEPDVANPALTLPITYLSRALVRTLPRLLGDPAKPQRLAFTVFDHQTGTLQLRVIECKGSDTSEAGKLFRIEDREGAIGAPSVLLVDQTGTIKKITSGPITMKQSTEAALLKQFGSQINQADAEMARLEEEFNNQEKRFGRHPARR